MTNEELLQIIYKAAKNGQTKLDLSGEKLVSLPPEIQQVRNLTWLDLSNNSFKELPPEIGHLQNLTWLDLSRNQFKRLPKELGQLKNLTWLNLSNNNLTGFPTWAVHLNELTWLSLRNNKLKCLSAKIGRLNNLSELNLSANLITHLSGEIGRLENLIELNLSNNKLDSLPIESANLKNLAILNIDANRFKVFPKEIFQLENLVEMKLGNNHLKELPIETIDLKNLKFLDLSNNELSIPFEFLNSQKDPDSIFSYYKRLQVELRKPLNEAKMILVGQGGVGKSSLAHRLIKDDFDPHKNKTEGIDIQSWKIGIDDQEICLNIWDFGGQEIMHATHQFFLTKRSLYLLVIDSRLGERENQVEYWLKMIQNFGGNSPTIIVGNKTDQQPLDIDQQGLRSKYKNIQSIIEISCATGHGLRLLRDMITEKIENLEHIHESLPLSWFKVREQLENISSDYISYANYEEICQTHSIEDDRDRSNLINLLHDLGIVLNFQSDPRLDNTNILNPEWITNSIYKILNNHSLITNCKGILRWSMLNCILDRDKYPKDKHRFIIDMMRRFELCFPLDDSNDQQFLIPDLLPRGEPDIGEWKNTLAFQYHYNILPNSIISRFIVRMNYRIHRQTYWRNGVVLRNQQNFALIKADREERKVFIWVDGCPSTRRDFLSQIRTHFDYIHDTTFRRESISRNNPVTEHIPLPDHPEIILEYQNLLNVEEMGETEYLIPELKKRINLRELLNGIESVETRQERESITKNYITNNYYQYGGGDNVAGDKAMGSKIKSC